MKILLVAALAAAAAVADAPKPLTDPQKVVILKARLVLDAAQQAVQQGIQQMQAAQKALDTASKVCGDSQVNFKPDGEPFCAPAVPTPAGK